MLSCMPTTQGATPEAQPVPEAPTPRDTALAFIVTKAFGDAAKAADKHLRSIAPDAFLEGDRVVVPSPYDRRMRLGTVTMTNPAPVASIDVASEDAFTAWMAERYPDQVEESCRILPGSMAAAIAVLVEHAPHLLDEPEVRVRPWAREAVLKASVAEGKPVGPGGEVDQDAPPGVTVHKPAGTPQVRMNPEAMPVIGQMLRDGTIDYMKALPGSSPDTAA